MSKKLLMNNYSKNGLMPVIDGLICWLDGRDYIAGENIWIDRSGNKNDIEIFNPSSKLSKGALYLSRNLKSYGKSKNIFNLSVKDEKTIEIKYKFNNNHVWGRVFSLNNRYAIQTDSYKYNLVNTGQKWTEVLIDKNNYNTITIVSDFKKNSIYKDSNLFFTDSANTNAIHLGNLFLNRESDTIQNPVDLYIASIKIYNRSLTEEEIQQNYLYEQSIERGE